MEDKISIRKMMVIFLIASAAPIIRVVPSYIAKTAKMGSALSPIIFLISALFFIYLVNKVLKKFKDYGVSTLEELMNKTIGKIFCKVILIICICSLLIICALQIRMFSERLTTTIYVYAKPEFFSICLLTITYVLSRFSIKGYARFCTILAMLFLGIYAFISIFSMQNFDIYNIYPVTIYDIPNIAQSSVIITSIFTTLIFTLFIWDKTYQNQNFLVSGKRATIAFFVIAVLTIMITIGNFGYEVVSSLPQPFFTAIKGNTFIGVLEGAQSIFISFWLMIDFAFISYYVLVITRLIEKLFNLRSRNTTISPTLFIIYLVSFLLGKSFFTLTEFSLKFLPIVMTSIGFAIPVIVLAADKFRNFSKKQTKQNKQIINSLKGRS